MAPAAPGFKIELKESFLQAWLRVLEPTGIVLSEVMHAAKTLGISYGIDHALLHKLAHTGFPPGEYLIAQGKYPETGQDAQVELLVKLVPKPRPVRIADEENRYFPVHLNSVIEGQKLLKYRPATNGLPGITVLGTERPSTPGRTCPNPRGMNTALSPTDPACLIAKVSGNLVWDGLLARVEPHYAIGGDLSLLNGDEINFAGHLQISGDIKVGMKLTIGGNLTVQGTVEDAIIDCGGDVVIRGGVFGSGHGNVTAGGSIEVNLAHDYILHCAHDITINREAINCQIRARSVLATRADVYGGTIVTQRLVEVRNLGKREYAKTSVTVGDRKQILDAIRAAHDEIKACETQMTDCSDWIIKLTRAKASGSGRGGDLDERLQAKRAQLDKLKQRVLALNQEAERLRADLEQIVPKLVVLGTVRHNIHLTVNDASLLIDNPETHVTFHEEERTILRSANGGR